MDGQRFDQLTRVWATSKNRRQMLRGLLGGVGLLVLGGRRAAAQEEDEGPEAIALSGEDVADIGEDVLRGTCGYPGFPCCPTAGGGPACLAGTDCIGGVCGFQVEVAAVVGGGTCAADCGPLTCCGTSCVDTASDPANCGGCGTDCAALLAGFPGPYGCSGGWCCFELNGACGSNTDCCNPSAVCSGQTPRNPIGFCCLPSGSACSNDIDCCSDACFGTCL